MPQITQQLVLITHLNIINYELVSDSDSDGDGDDDQYHGVTIVGYGREISRNLSKLLWHQLGYKGYVKVLRNLIVLKYAPIDTLSLVNT